MRRSSRIAFFLLFSADLVSAADAGSLRGARIGGARVVSPVRQLVGGAPRGVSPASVDARQGTDRAGDWPWHGRVGSRHGFEGHEIGGYGTYGYGVGDGGAAGPGPIDQGQGPGPDFVIMAPPKPCVSPQIIRIGQSAPTHHRAAAPPRVVYGTPGCGRF